MPSITLNGRTYTAADFKGYGYVTRFPEQIFADFLAELALREVGEAWSQAEEDALFAEGHKWVVRMDILGAPTTTTTTAAPTTTTTTAAPTTTTTTAAPTTTTTTAAPTTTTTTAAPTPPPNASLVMVPHLAPTTTVDMIIN